MSILRNKPTLKCHIWLALCIYMIMAISATPAIAKSPKYGGKLVIAHGADVRHLEPHTSVGWEAAWVEQNIYSGLVTLNSKLQPAPDLAKSWTIISDGLTYIFKLHKNVKFHDGTVCDASVVKWNIERVLNPKTRAGLRPFFAPVVEKVEAPNDTTVVIKLKKPYSMLLTAMAGYRMGLLIISPTYLEKVGIKGYKSHPIGTGPFIFKEWIPNSHITLVKNPNYFKKGLPYLDQITYRAMKDATVKTMAFMKKEIDVYMEAGLEQVPLLEKYKGGKVVIGLEVTPLGFIPCLSNKAGVPHKIFHDKRVRQAVMGYGVNRKEIVDNAMMGKATPAVSMILPGTPGHTDLTAMYPYDRKRQRPF